MKNCGLKPLHKITTQLRVAGCRPGERPSASPPPPALRVAPRLLLRGRRRPEPEPEPEPGRARARLPAPAPRRLARRPGEHRAALSSPAPLRGERRQRRLPHVSPGCPVSQQFPPGPQRRLRRCCHRLSHIPGLQRSRRRAATTTPRASAPSSAASPLPAGPVSPRSGGQRRLWRGAGGTRPAPVHPTHPRENARRRPPGGGCPNMQRAGPDAGFRGAAGGRAAGSGTGLPSRPLPRTAAPQPSRAGPQRPRSAWPAAGQGGPTAGKGPDAGPRPARAKKRPRPERRAGAGDRTE